MKEIWLTKRGEPYHRYMLNPCDCVRLYNGDYTRMFHLQKFWGEDDDWKPWGRPGDEGFYVDIVTLLSEFILVDSDNDKYIKHLEELRDNNFRKQQDASISLLTDAMASIQQPENGDPQGTKNEENRENIHTLHSEQLEGNETAAAE